MDNKFIRYGLPILFLIIIVGYAVVQFSPLAPESSVELSERTGITQITPSETNSSIANQTADQLIPQTAKAEVLRQTVLEAHSQQHSQDVDQTVAQADQLIADIDLRLADAGIAVPDLPPSSTHSPELSTQQARLQSLRQSLR